MEPLKRQLTTRISKRKTKHVGLWFGLGVQGVGDEGAGDGLCFFSSSKGLGYSKNISLAANQRETGSSSRDVCCC